MPAKDTRIDKNFVGILSCRYVKVIKILDFIYGVFITPLGNK